MSARRVSSVTLRMVTVASVMRNVSCQVETRSGHFLFRPSTSIVALPSVRVIIVSISARNEARREGEE